MILMPILFVDDVEASVAFYARLGFGVEQCSRSLGWAELQAGDGALLALHATHAGQSPGMELSMVAEEPLERLAGELPVARGVADEAFGRSIVLRDPDGRDLQINEHDPELYT
jgi:catechol 2,3-dioxygenase-like lactoylglutathione lyase family enzyme